MSYDLRWLRFKRLDGLLYIKMLSRRFSFENLLSCSFEFVIAKKRAFQPCLSHSEYINEAFIGWSLTFHHFFRLNSHIISQLHLVEFIVRTGHVEVSRLSDYNLAHFVDEDALRFGEEPQRCQCMSSYTLNELLQVKLLFNLDLCFVNQSLVLGFFATKVTEIFYNYL